MLGAFRPLMPRCSVHLLGVVILALSGLLFLLVLRPGPPPRYDTTPQPLTADVHLVPLRRESVPVKRKGKVVSFKTSYSGIINVGRPAAQEFRVVFDTGSGHIVLPSVECQSEACIVHRRYNKKASGTAVSINLDGSPVPVGKLCDRVTIGFGTGSVRGEFVHELVCLGEAPRGGSGLDGQPCANSFAVMAIEMSTSPFKNFGFDGIIGLGLKSLSLSKQYNFFNMLTEGRQVLTPRFGFFLTDGENGEESEIAFGGHNPARLLTPLAWTNVSKPELGYWQLQVLAFRIGNTTMDFCQSGKCNAILDTGTSHLGIPTPFERSISEMLTTPANGMLDCRLADLPTVEIEVPGFNITLYPENYMRRLPLREDVNVSSMDGFKNASGSQLGATAAKPTTPAAEPSLLASVAPDPAQGAVQRYCRPRFMPVSLPEPLGPNLFILGEPVLHRYYTVFDWGVPQVGFGLSNSNQNSLDRSLITDRVGSLPHDVEVYLMQKDVKASRREEGADSVGDEYATFVQITISVIVSE